MSVSSSGQFCFATQNQNGRLDEIQNLIIQFYQNSIYFGLAGE